MVRVLLQQNTVAHYRVRLYECLKAQAGLDFEFIADPESDTPHMATAEAAGHALDFTRSRVWTLRLPGVPDLFFQPGAVLRLLLGEFDVVIALGSPYSITTWLMLLIGPLVGTRVLLWTHGLLARESGPKWWLRWLLYRASSGLLLYGNRARELLVSQGLTKTPLFVVRNSLDPEAQARAEASVSPLASADLRERLGMRTQHRGMIFIGRLQPVKRLDLLVRAVARLNDRGRQVHAILLGDGDERTTLQRLADESGVAEFVHFEGTQYDEAVIARYFAVSDVCVIPSGAGLTVMHALGYGTPVVTHDRAELQFPEVEAISSGQTGLFYAEGDLESLVSVLERSLFPEPMKISAGTVCRARIAADFHPRVQAQAIGKAALWAAGRASE